ncbi:MAG: hypothetical protein WD894_12650 [Pirellulales bacterium]
MLRALSIALVVWGGTCSAELAAEGSQSAAKPADAQPATSPKSKEVKPAAQVRWKAAENNTWQWYERETLVNGQWKLTGITPPVHRNTGEYYRGATGYLEQSAVPHEVRRRGSIEAFEKDAKESDEPGRPDPIRRAREGRPASKWLRSLGVNELRKWLPTIDVPEAGVEDMTYWEHLTRDHGFDPARIEGLTDEEQAKLHAAAHAGY